MPRQADGTFTRDNSVFQGRTTWDQQANSGDDTIRSDRHDYHDNDLGDALTDSLSRSGSGAMQADLSVSTFKVVGSGFQNSEITPTNRNQARSLAAQAALAQHIVDVDDPQYGGDIAAALATGHSIWIGPNNERNVTGPYTLNNGQFVYGAGSGICTLKPTADNDIFRVVGQRCGIVNLTIDGSNLTTGTVGNGIVVGFGAASGSTGQACYINNVRVRNMRAAGLVWEQGSFLHIDYILVSNNIGNGATFLATATDNNHGDLVIHASNNGGWGLDVQGGNSPITNDSRAHFFRSVKAFGNAGGGVQINSRGNAGNIFVEDNTGSQLTLGSAAEGNQFFIPGVQGTVDSFTDNGTSNTVIGFDSVSELKYSDLRVKAVKVRDSSLTGGLQTSVTGNAEFKTALTNTNQNATLDFLSDGSGILTTRFEALRVGIANGRTYNGVLRGTSTINVSVPANGTATGLVNVTGVVASGKVQDVQAGPRSALPAGISVAGAWEFGSAGQVRVQLANVTSGNIQVNQSFWAQVWQS